MPKIKLFKDEKLILEKTGIKDKDNYIFDNIVYNSKDINLIREDDNFKYLLDFKNNTATVTIKQNNYSLDLILNTTDIKRNNKNHKIYYTIESDDLINNRVEITF